MKRPTYEEQKQEALERLIALGLPESVTEAFQNRDTVYICSDSGAEPFAASDREVQAIARFEEKYKAKVFLILRSETIYGDLDALLFVNQMPSEWDIDRKQLGTGFPVSYVIAWDKPEYSEFGTIEIGRSANGGIIRVA